jgi:hypothetical protein
MIETGYVPEHYDGNDADSSFVFEWRILQKSDLVVKVLTIATGVVVTLELDTDYTIADEWVDNEDGGQIETTDPVATGDRIWLIRDTAKTQLVNIVEGSPFPAATVTKVFDRLTMMVQELIYLSRMALKFRAVSTFVDVDVPDPEDLMVLGWLNDLLVNVEVDNQFVGGEEDVSEDDDTLVIVFDTEQENTDYQVISVGPSWMTSWNWESKLTTGFTIVFSNPAPADAKATWRVKVA